MMMMNEMIDEAMFVQKSKMTMVVAVVSVE